MLTVILILYWDSFFPGSVLGTRNDQGENMAFLPSGSSQSNKRDTEANEQLQRSVRSARTVGSAGYFSGDMREEETLTGGEGGIVTKPSQGRWHLIRSGRTGRSISRQRSSKVCSD